MPRLKTVSPWRCLVEVWCGRCAKPCAGLANFSETLAQEHLSGKLKEHCFSQVERDPCLFANEKLDVCIGVHVDDMLAVGPNNSTQTLMQELAMVTERPQEFLGLSLRNSTQRYNFGDSCGNVKQLCNDFGFGELKGFNTFEFEKP